MARYAYIIQVTEGWYEDYDDKYLLKEAFTDESDAMNYCDRLCTEEIKKWREEDIADGYKPSLYQGVWHGNRLTKYMSRDNERFDWKNDPIEHKHWEIIRLNLHN